MRAPDDLTVEGFDEWLSEATAHGLEGKGEQVPMVRWGPQHTKIAAAFAEHWATRAVRRTLDQALNSGDGAYRP
jgi:hypothetical protein